MFKLIRNNIKYILLIVICITGSMISSYATSYLFDSKDVSFDNSNNDILADDVQGAIDELYACATKYADFDTNLNTLANSLNSYNLRITALEEEKSNIIDAYPVGSVYISVSDTNPATLFGGTWEQLKDRFLLGTGDTYSNGTTGGAATVSLSQSQMASSTPAVRSCGGGDWNFGNWGAHGGGYCLNLPGQYGTSGQGAAHNNMPPYLVVYMWKRTA